MIENPSNISAVDQQIDTINSPDDESGVVVVDTTAPTTSATTTSKSRGRSLKKTPQQPQQQQQSKSSVPTGHFESFYVGQALDVVSEGVHCAAIVIELISRLSSSSFPSSSFSSSSSSSSSLTNPTSSSIDLTSAVSSSVTQSTSKNNKNNQKSTLTTKPIQAHLLQGVKVHYIGWKAIYDEIITDFTKFQPAFSGVQRVKVWASLSDNFPLWPCIAYVRCPIVNNARGMDYLTNQDKLLFVMPCLIKTMACVATANGVVLSAPPASPAMAQQVKTEPTPAGAHRLITVAAKNNSTAIANTSVLLPNTRQAITIGDWEDKLIKEFHLSEYDNGIWIASKFLRPFSVYTPYRLQSWLPKDFDCAACKLTLTEYCNQIQSHCSMLKTHPFSIDVTTLKFNGGFEKNIYEALMIHKTLAKVGKFPAAATTNASGGANPPTGSTANNKKRKSSTNLIANRSSKSNGDDEIVPYEDVYFPTSGNHGSSGGESLPKAIAKAIAKHKFTIHDEMVKSATRDAVVVPSKTIVKDENSVDPKVKRVKVEPGTAAAVVDSSQYFWAKKFPTLITAATNDDKEWKGGGYSPGGKVSGFATMIVNSFYEHLNIVEAQKSSLLVDGDGATTIAPVSSSASSSQLSSSNQTTSTAAGGIRSSSRGGASLVVGQKPVPHSSKTSPRYQERTRGLNDEVWSSLCSKEILLDNRSMTSYFPLTQELTLQNGFLLNILNDQEIKSRHPIPMNSGVGNIHQLSRKGQQHASIVAAENGQEAITSSSAGVNGIPDILMTSLALPRISHHSNTTH